MSILLKIFILKVQNCFFSVDRKINSQLCIMAGNSLVRPENQIECLGFYSIVNSYHLFENMVNILENATIMSIKKTKNHSFSSDGLLSSV